MMTSDSAIRGAAAAQAHNDESMRFPTSVLDEIKMRLPVTAVVGKRVRLIKAGREWKGLSPFNSEKTPSFFVNDDKQRYFDFSSGKNGDIFTFLMETEGLTFNEAVERLAAEAGVTLPRLTGDDSEREERRRGLHEAIEIAAAFFEAELAGERGARARSYLDGRGLGGDVRRRFRLGYAPADRFALRDLLAAKGFTREQMIDAGLLISGDDIAVPYDRFRDRVMFPIADPRGRVVAFGGRALGPDAQPKYLNSPETPLFHKGGLLYNFHHARAAMRAAAPADGVPAGVIVVEGYVDVIAMSLAGLQATVAPLGTALTPDQLALIWRAGDVATLCFDGDKAGRRAAYRALDLALPLLVPGKSANFVLLPDGQDPDDLLRSGGAGAVRSAVAAALPLVELLWMREADATPLDTPDQRAALEHRLREIVGAIRDETVRRHYRAELDRRMGALLPAPASPRRASNYVNTGYGNKGPGRGGAGRPGAPGRNGFAAQAGPLRASTALTRHPMFMRQKRGEHPREALVLLVLLAHPRLLVQHCEALAEIEFAGPEARRLAQQLIDCVAVHDEAEEDGEAGLRVRLREQLRRAGLDAAAERLRLLLRPGDTWALAADADLLDVEEMLRQVMVLHRRAGALNSELRAAERALADDESEANLAWLRDVKMQLTSLEGTEADVDGFTHRGHLPT